VEVHITQNYDVRINYGDGHMFVSYFLQVWNAHQIAQYNFEKDGQLISDRSNFFVFDNT
jgi:hypothetical protein